jgi:hypothetical protein
MSTPKEWNHGEADPAAIEAFTQYACALGDELPEVQAELPQILETGTAWIDAHQLEPAFFDDDAHGLLFTGLIKRGAEAYDTSNETAQNRELAIAKNGLILLTHRFSPVLEREAEQIIDQGDVSLGIRLSPHGWEAICDAFTDRHLTEQFQKEIPGLVGDVKERLGVTPDNEQEYRLRVLAFNGAFDREPEERFKEVTGIRELPAAWVEEDGQGGKTMFLRRPLVRGIRDNPDSPSRRRTLKHEYVHTQTDYSIEPHTGIGTFLDELHADVGSGDERDWAYPEHRADYHAFNQDGRTLEQALFSQAPQDLAGTVRGLAHEVGLNSAVELAIVPPEESQVLSQDDYSRNLRTLLGTPLDCIQRIANLEENTFET